MKSNGNSNEVIMMTTGLGVAAEPDSRMVRSMPFSAADALPVEYEHDCLEQYADIANQHFGAMLKKLTLSCKSTVDMDYDGVSEVEYDTENRLVVALSAHPVMGSSVGVASPYTRTNVIRSIQAGANFTMLRNYNGQWINGPRIFVVVVNGVEYLKTGIDMDAADRLEFDSLI